MKLSVVMLWRADTLRPPLLHCVSQAYNQAMTDTPEAPQRRVARLMHLSSAHEPRDICMHPGITPLQGSALQSLIELAQDCDEAGAIHRWHRGASSAKRFSERYSGLSQELSAQTRPLRSGPPDRFSLFIQS
jgi:hypothetical protein